MIKLSQLKTGERGIVVKVLGHGAFRKRVIEMGFVRGQEVEVLQAAPLRDPVQYLVMGYDVSLRRSEADLIEVVRSIDHTEEDDENRFSAAAQPKHNTEEVRRKVDTHGHTINAVLIGNPNCGKTSLFNSLCHTNEHVGNYSGVTVDARRSTLRYGGYTFNIVDLPGTYSLTAYSPEELYVRRYLRDFTPDVVINVVDSSNLERNLYLTTELIDMDTPMVIALNMYDELRSTGGKLDYEALGAMIGVPMVPLVARTGDGRDNLLDTIISVFERRDPVVRHVHVNLGADVENAVRRLVDVLKAEPAVDKGFSPRYMAIRLLEGDREIEDSLPSNIAVVPRPDTMSDDGAPLSLQSNRLLILRDSLRGRIESLHDEDINSIVAAEKYGFIAGALAETFTPGKVDGKRATRFLDAVATNKLVGFPVFFAIMFSIFWLTFVLGQYPVSWIENAVAWISRTLNLVMSSGPLKDLVADGIVGGVGGVIVFLPNILILYFCISFMEDSGYMARAAFIMDKVMHRIGLHGKSFIPLIMGFGCNVPAIMASRAIESRSSRIITILINPFMSCSARLPVYVLLVGTFFPTHAALVFMGLYILGILVAMLTARLLRRFLFKKDETPFVMELPPYRLPTLRASLRHTWEKGKEYIRKMGGIILFASIVVWALNYFPMHRQQSYEVTAAENMDDDIIDPSRDSYLEMMGKFINPVMKPLGFNWRASVAALAGVPAKEIVVSTLGVLYTGDGADDSERLGARLSSSSTAGRQGFTPAVALSFMIFILLYCPCLATVAAIARETGTWWYSLFSIVYNTAVAWLIAFAVYRIILLL